METAAVPVEYTMALLPQALLSFMSNSNEELNAPKVGSPTRPPVGVKETWGGPAFP